VADYRDLLGQIDAAILAAPTRYHAQIARDLLDHHVHLLVEKPLAATHVDAQELAERAARENLILAVGHVERFNPAFLAAQHRHPAPLYIEAVRTGGFTFRSLDVGVVMDLMIHDLELILALVDSPVTSVSAFGAPVVTPHEDLAEARLLFANGCVAQLKSSRTSPTAQRQMSIYSRNEHCFIDFGQRSVRVVGRSAELQAGTLHVETLAASEIESLKSHVFETLLPTTDLEVAEANPLRDELADFLDSVHSGRRPRVSGHDGAQAVWLAEQILAQIHTVPAIRRAA
jgi:predicted dehydrogenase